MIVISAYGFPFHKNSVLVIRTANEEALHLLKEARRTDGVHMSVFSEGYPDDIPEEIYLLSDDTWYGTRFHGFRYDDGKISFILHGVRPMFMATAELKKYRIVYDSGNVILYIKQQPSY